MKLSLGVDELATYLGRQIDGFFPDGSAARTTLKSAVERAVERLEHCFSHLKQKYYFNGAQTVFNHLHTDQYAIFLYFVSNSIHRMEGDLSMAAKVYALNKALHGLDAFYEVRLPDIFGVQHPVGTVLGRATYSNYFFVYQRCSIGANLAQVYPTIGEGVIMYGGSAIIGASTIGNNCWLSVGTTVMDTGVPSDTVVFGRSPKLTIKPARRHVIRDIFRMPVSADIGAPCVPSKR